MLPYISCPSKGTRLIEQVTYFFHPHPAMHNNKITTVYEENDYFNLTLLIFHTWIVMHLKSLVMVYLSYSLIAEQGLVQLRKIFLKDYKGCRCPNEYKRFKK